MEGMVAVESYDRWLIVENAGLGAIVDMVRGHRVKGFNEKRHQHENHYESIILYLFLLF